MFCSRCGAKNSDTARFCTSCGAPLGSRLVAGQQPGAVGSGGSGAAGTVGGSGGGPVAAGPVAGGSGQPAAAAPVSAPRKRKLPVLAVVAAVLVLAVVGVAVWGVALGGFASFFTPTTAKTYVLDSSGTETLYCTETLNEDGVVVASYTDDAAEYEATGSGAAYEINTNTCTYTDDGDLLSYEIVRVDTDAYKEESEYATDRYYLETFAYEYDAAGNPISVTAYASWEEGVEPTQTATATLEYDSEGRLVALTTIDTNDYTDYTLEVNITYTADDAVSSFAWTSTVLDDPSDTGGLTARYTYDDEGRLTEVASEGTGAYYLLVNGIGGITTNYDGSIRILEALHDIRELAWGMGVYASYDVYYLAFWDDMTYGYNYNEQGDLARIWSESDTYGEITGCTYGYEYDSWGRITKLTKQIYEQNYDQYGEDEQATPVDYQIVTYYEYS